jgi:hypothetical protein
LEQRIIEQPDVRSKIISIGIPILMCDGRRLLRGPNVEIPPPLGRVETPITPENIDVWAEAGWVDLRESNLAQWQSRAQTILAETSAIPQADSSSRYEHDRLYWSIDEPLNVGKLAAWIFVHEDKGLRVKR